MLVSMVGAMNIKMRSSSNRANKLLGADWLKHSFSIWRDLDKTPEEKKISSLHPAIFSIAVVKKLIECYVPDNGKKILDCFAGTGSTLVAAHQSGLRGIGIDISKEYKDIFLQRVNFSRGMQKNLKYLVGDARTVLTEIKKNSIDFCVTSPPYWDILNRVRSADKKKITNYSDKPEDLGNVSDYKVFLEIFLEISQKVFDTLKDRSYFVVNVMDLRKGANFYPLHMDIAMTIKKAGFSLEDIIVWDRQKEYNNSRPLGYPYKFIINKVHEYFLVFRKNTSGNVQKSTTLTKGDQNERNKKKYS